MSIFIFSWNTQSYIYTENTADFLILLAEKIFASNCTFVVIGLQEDAINESIIVQLLQQRLNTKYNFITSIEMAGWGATTVKAAITEFKYLSRGLRIALFQKNTSTLLLNYTCRKIVCPSIRDWITHGKGCVAINLEFENTRIIFANVHLPFSSKTLLKDRYEGMLWQEYCLKYIYTELNQVSTTITPKMFLFGDLNFRVQITDSATEIAEKLINDTNYIYELHKSDELLLLKEQITNWPFKEGVQNKGPCFIPTFKLRINRVSLIPEIFRCGKKNHRSPSWCDRILYNDQIDCICYNRFDELAMNKSDHAAIYGVFIINEPKEQ
jgi:hypothetical protein